MFNDSFALLDASSNQLQWNRKNISWPTDRQVKFGKPSEAVLANSVKPPSWAKTVAQRNGYNGDDDFMVWMRTAALPSFRKLYAYLEDGIKAGTYTLLIDYSFPVTQFDGTKKLVLSQISWLGGKNDAMGIAYIVVGIVHMLLGGIFLIIDLHLIRRYATFHPIS
ncbi:Cell cycle control protein 50A [Cichlidogyrus casuarinus]|uniref:Cell cycle control protein 50A n=1 Tax=Cichlidogyrus casuarinus TaxID=1844966 RepID=A0ABD2Q592_9PLAT